MNTRLIRVLGLALAVALPYGCGGQGGDQTATTTPATSPSGTPGDQTGPPGGMPGSPMGAPPGGMMPGSPMGTMPGQMQTGALPGRPAGAAGAQKVAAVGPPPGGLNRDPFLIRWKKPPEPPFVFNEIQPIRLASDNVETPAAPNTEVTEVATRRVSGIMTGNGVYAILESNAGDPEIVKPGSETRDGYKVISINADSVKLQRKEGNYILTQTVPLTDAPVGNAQPASYGGGMPGGGMPGGIPGAGYPGMPGGGRFGGGLGGAKAD